MALKSMEAPVGLEVMEEGKPFFFEGSRETGCLLIHGFTGTTSSMKLMGDFMAGRGLTVLGPRLPGHGTDVDDMCRWGCEDWKKTVEDAFDELSGMCEKVFVSGLSMGGLLTLYLGEVRADKVAGLAPINAPIVRLAPGLQFHALKIVPVLKHLLKTFPGPGNDVKDPRVTEVAYEKLSTNALHELIKLEKMVRADLGRVVAPIRVFKSKEDHVIPAENAGYIIGHVSSTDKEIIWLEDSYHVATIDNDKDRIFEESYNFFSGSPS